MVRSCMLYATPTHVCAVLPGLTTLVTRVSAARPNIGAYPYSTLTPTLGIVR